MPVLFGAVHPVVIGAYTSFILIIIGGWLLLNSRVLPGNSLFSRRTIVLFVLITWIICSIIPLPLSLLESISPIRAAYLQHVNQLAEMQIVRAPLAYNSSAAIMTAIFLFALFLYGTALKVLLAADRSLLQRILYACIGIGLLEAVYGMLQAINPELGVLWLTDITQFKGMARGTIIYKNQYASLLNMCWPLAVGAALLHFRIRPSQSRSHRKKSQHTSKRKRSRSEEEYIASRRLRGTVFLFLASFIMMAVVFSQSRGGIISMAIILLLLLVALPVSKKNKLRLTGVLLLFVVLYGSFIDFSSVVERFMRIQESGQGRFRIWLSSLTMLSDHLAVGIGVGAYESLSSVYLKQFPEQIIFDRAHNDYLEFAIEFGLPAALFFFCSFFIILAGYARHLCSYSTKKLPQLRSATIIALVAFAGIIGFLFHGTADFGWRLPVNLLYFTTLLVLLVHGTRPQPQQSHHYRHTSRLRPAVTRKRDDQQLNSADLHKRHKRHPSSSGR